MRRFTNSIILIIVIAITASFSHAAIEIVGSYSDKPAYDLKVRGDFAYITGFATKQLYILNISNPAIPTLVGTYTSTANEVREVALIGDYAYIACSWDGFEVIDISDPSSPTKVGPTHSGSGVAVAFEFANGYGFLANRESGIRVFDVSDPANPVYVTTYSTSTSYAWASSITISGNYLYIGIEHSPNGFEVFDISNPAVQNKVGTISGTNSVFGIAKDGNYVYHSGQWEHTFNVVDVTDPSSPVRLGSGFPTHGDPWGIAISGNVAFLGERAFGLQILDISDKANPTLLDEIDTFGDPLWGIQLAGDYVFLSNGDGGMLVLKYRSELTAPFSTTTPTVDGVIDTTEWQDASQYNLNFVHDPIHDSIVAVPIYLLNDGTFLYCASHVPFDTAWEAYFGIFIDGDHSHTLNGVASEPHIDIGYNKAGTPSPRYPIYDAYWYLPPPCGAYSPVTPPAGTDHAFSGTTEVSYEFKILLADLTALPGDTVGLHMQFGTGDSGLAGYHFPIPPIPCDTANWAQLPHLVIESGGVGDSLLIPSVSVKPCDECEIGYAVQPVMTNLTQPINGASIPIEIPPEVDSICGISYDGLLTQDWDIKGDSIDYENGWIHVYLANTFGYRIPAGTTTVFNILFTAPRECTTSYYIHWDTALSDDPQRSLLYSDTNDMDLTAYFDLDRDSTEILGYVQGDVNDDGSVNIADLTYLVGYLFRGGPAPCVMNAADCNGSCTGPNIADLTYLVSYLFQGGPAPVCGCLGGGEPALKVSADISVSTAYDNGITTITLNSPVDLRGLQLVVSGDEAAKPVSLVDSRLELLCSNNSGEVAIGLVDLQGEAIIEAGTQRVIQLNGEFEVTEAIVSDMNHRDIAASIGTARETTLPTEFALDQNYPNPFNPTTEINFSLPSASDVKLEVYNIMGQRVVTLVDGFFGAGQHSAVWDASSIASGIYFYRLTANEFVETKKMMLLK